MEKNRIGHGNRRTITDTDAGSETEFFLPRPGKPSMAMMGRIRRDCVLRKKRNDAGGWD
ncbi:Os01g0710250, partial [Oryza sativa Japonica Group]